MKIQISHEVPIPLLETSLKWNDYDYSLVHLFDEYPKYYQFYKYHAKYRKQIMDNSAYELGDSFDQAKFISYVEDIKPSHYIIPDKIADFETTLQYAREFPKLPGKSIGVLQGNTLEELIECYQFMNELVDTIAIPFHSPYYQLIGESSPLQNMCSGRPLLVKKLLKLDVINTKKEHHLLGCSLPREFSAYQGLPFITSLDTSNPVLLGLTGQLYPGIENLSSKIVIKMDSVINQETSHLELIKNNVKTFRDFILN